MNRRGFVRAGAGILAIGASGVQPAALAAPPSPRTSPTIFDFGAVGDGSTDDSAAFGKALEVAAQEGRTVVVPSLTYAIARPISFVSTGNAGRTWGLACQGATLVSKITNGEDVLSMTSKNVVRYFRISGGLTIVGSGSDGNGLRLFATGSSYFYNAMIEGLSIERMGGHGLLFEGNVFESMILNSYFQDCKKNGATFAHSKGGVCSAISIIGSFFNQNGSYGMAATSLDTQYGGTTDVRVYGGYCRDNKGYGFFYNNGTSPGAAITQVGFENNCRARAPGDPEGAHIYGLTAMQLRNCTGYNEGGGATYLLRGWFSSLTVIEGCNQSAGGAMAASRASRLVQINGNGSGHVVMRASTGGIDVAKGNTCTWTAEYCSGPSPRGELNVRGTLSSA